MLKNLILKIVRKQYYNSETYVKYLKSRGLKLGDNVVFYDPSKKPIDEQRIPFIKIGNSCRITEGVKILGHDYSYATLRPIYHEMLLKTDEVIIGNNVFIGINSIILMGTKIGDNSIIGAGSVVSGKFPSNVVIAGNPAKVICSIDEYYNKLKKNFERNAILYYKILSDDGKRNVNEEKMLWYNCLWDTEKKEDIFKNIKIDGDIKEEVIQDMLEIRPKYKSFKDFILSIEKRNHNEF